MLRRSLTLIALFALVLGSLTSQPAYAGPSAPGNADLGEGPGGFAEPEGATLDSIHSSDTIFGVIENGKTTIALRVCGQGPHFQLRSENVGSWLTEVFYRTAAANGCSPSPTSWWKMVINADAGTGERFRIYTTAYENPLCEKRHPLQAGASTNVPSGLPERVALVSSRYWLHRCRECPVSTRL